MKKLIIITMVLLILCACAQIESTEVEETTIGDTTFNDDFILTIVVEEFSAELNRPINCYATLAYTGTKPITIYHSDPLVVFGIEDNKYFDNGYTRNDILLNTTFKPKDELHIEFQKSGGWSADDPNASFYENFYKDKELKLPKGEYSLSANLSYSLDQNNIVKTQKNLTSSVIIVVNK